MCTSLDGIVELRNFEAGQKAVHGEGTEIAGEKGMTRKGTKGERRGGDERIRVSRRTH
jgi:hypothetical protein